MSKTYAVYIHREHNATQHDTDLYGAPVATGQDYVTAMEVALALARFIYGDAPGAFDVHQNGIMMAGRPGSPSMDILIWNESNQR